MASGTVFATGVPFFSPDGWDEGADDSVAVVAVVVEAVAVAVA